MKRKILLIAFLASFTLAVFAGGHEKNIGSENIAAATKFMNTLLTDRDTADSLLHEDFDFMFMGVSQISNVKYNREAYWSVWMDNVVAPLVPEGFKKVEVTDAIGDRQSVALMVEGDAEGVNGRYNNKYVFIFKFKEGKIISLREYTSDLLVETRLYKQKLVEDN
tara:strand:+ start:1499 stop:1993 length:495 start_codon:yes stop_codon:yes gene_type:complete